jgi:hypothetical protein
MSTYTPLCHEILHMYTLTTCNFDQYLLHQATRTRFNRFYLIIHVIWCIEGILATLSNVLRYGRKTHCRDRGNLIRGTVVKVISKSKGIRLEETYDKEGKISFELSIPRKYIDVKHAWSASKFPKNHYYPQLIHTIEAPKSSEQLLPQSLLKFLRKNAPAR